MTAPEFINRLQCLTWKIPQYRVTYEATALALATLWPICRFRCRVVEH